MLERLGIRRPVGSVVATLWLFGLGMGLVSPCLDTDGDQPLPGYYDGDDDDVGLVPDPTGHAPAIALVRAAGPRLAPPEPRRASEPDSGVLPSIGQPRVLAPRAPP